MASTYGTWQKRDKALLRHWNRLPWAVVESPLLGLLKRLRVWLLRIWFGAGHSELDQRLESVIIEIFSKLNYSVIL